MVAMDPYRLQRALFFLIVVPIFHQAKFDPDTYFFREAQKTWSPDQKV